MNSLQVNDMLMGGLNNAMEALAAHRERNEEMRQVNYSNDLSAWKNYAGQLVEKNQNLVTNLRVLIKDFDAIAKELHETRIAYKSYTRVLTFKIKILDSSIVRHSANAYALGKMRDRLVNKLKEVADPTTETLLDPKEQARLLDQDWDYFRETNKLTPETGPIPPPPKI